jgi:hypothetical protein
LSYPYFNPDYREILRKVVSETKDIDRLIAKQVRDFRFIEQDISTYYYIVKPESPSSTIAPNFLAPAVDLKQHYTLFLDFVGYLHSSFELSPYIRVPARGKSLNQYISRLSPSQQKKTQDNRSLSKNIVEIGNALASNLPSEAVSFVDDFADGIFAISDLPIEWLLIKDTPLAFLCDVCRIPETPSTSILSQFNNNKLRSFKITDDILQNTLVVCGATPEDPIFKTYKDQIDLQKREGKFPYRTTHIQSKDEFFGIVNEMRPHLLVIDSHGDFKNQADGSYIWIGKEKVTGNDIVERLPPIPLVILSCCWGTPIYGNSNTIAQAFFEQGSFSVLSTFLPISITSGSLLYFRILNNLSYAAKHGLHESWMSFVSHNIRTSYINDLFTPIFEKFGRDILEHESYTKLCLDWSLNCMDRKKRHTAYSEAKEIVLQCIRSSHRSRAEHLLKSKAPIPEFMLYTHLGRGDLVKFNSWIQDTTSE